jgi:hypothetical protein
MNRRLFSSAEILAESIREKHPDPTRSRHEKKLGQFGFSFLAGFAVTFLTGVVLLIAILWRY